MLSSAEVYDPVANTWTAVSNTMTDPRGDGPGAATLRDGRVLVMGGTTTRTPFAVSSVTADLYNPATNAFSRGGKHAREPHIVRVRPARRWARARGRWPRGVSRWQ